MLRERVLTSVCLVLVFVVSLFVLPWYGFALLMSLVLLVAAWEWANLSGYQRVYQRLIYVLFTGGLMLCLAYYTGIFGFTIDRGAVFTIMLIAGSWWALALLWVQGYPASAFLWGNLYVKGCMGWFVLLPAWLGLAYLHQSPKGPWLLLLVVLTVITADTGAYFFGKAWGRRKLAIHVSPGKSWEGFLGGICCCLLLAGVVSWLTHFDAWPQVLAILLATALASVLGDLLESMVKRQRGIKDSGCILPGHGGVLDRVDGITAAVPVFVLGGLITDWGL